MNLLALTVLFCLFFALFVTYFLNLILYIMLLLSSLMTENNFWTSEHWLLTTTSWKLFVFFLQRVRRARCELHTAFQGTGQNPRNLLEETTEEKRTEVLVIPAYKQKCMQEAPVTRSIKKWSDEADAKLHDCFASTDWIMFQESSDGIEEYSTCFINKCIDDVVPTVTVRTYPNQKPWITGNIRTELKGRAASFKERDSNQEAYKKSRYALRRTIKHAKCQYRT